jgi:hypothetical protein
MASNGNRVATELIVRKGEALISVPGEENGEPITRVYVRDLRAPIRPNADTLALARSARGAWRELDWEYTVAELDRIRHESTPTPPLDLDDIL